MKKINIGNVSLPRDSFVVSRTAILGITKSGKTYGAKGIVEQLLDENIPVVIFDAIGVWRWLRTAVPGPNGKAYKIVVAGGSAPDIPLTVDTAEAIVRAAIHSNIPLIIDLYDPHLSKADWRRIVQKCCHVLLYENNYPRLVVIEEAAEYVPQNARDVDGATFASVEKIVRMGGNAQLGVMLLNQRAQEVNKSVLELCDNVVLLRQRGKNAIDSLEKWMDRISSTHSREISKSLPTLKAGECWVWTEDDEEPIRAQTRLLKSHHPDRTKTDRITLNRVNSSDFVSTMKTELQKVLESKPEPTIPADKQLTKKLADAQAQLEQSKNEYTAIKEKYRAHLNRLREFEQARHASLLEILGVPNRETSDFLAFPSVPSALERDRATAVADTPEATTLEEVKHDRNFAKFLRSDTVAAGKGTLSQQILTTLAQHQDTGIPVDRGRLALYLGRHKNDKSLANMLSSMRTAGLLEKMSVTKKGLQELGDYNPLPSGRALLDWFIRHKLTRQEAAIVTIVSQRDGHDKSTIATLLDKHPNDKGLANTLSRLRGMGLIVKFQINPLLKG